MTVGCALLEILEYQIDVDGCISLPAGDEKTMFSPACSREQLQGGGWCTGTELESLRVPLPSGFKQHRPPSCAMVCLLQLQVWLK